LPWPRIPKLALDPTLSALEVAAARREVDDCVRPGPTAEAARRLGARLTEVKRAEEQDRLRQEYDRVRSVRHGLAAELAEIYPEIESRPPT
jgi:hypothetical protein